MRQRVQTRREMKASPKIAFNTKPSQQPSCRNQSRERFLEGKAPEKPDSTKGTKNVKERHAIGNTVKTNVMGQIKAARAN